MKDLLKVVTVVSLLVLLLSKCNDPVPQRKSVVMYYGTDSSIGVYQDSIVTVHVPFGVHRDSLLVVVGGVSQGIQDFTHPKVTENGFIIMVSSFTDIPIVYINTVAPIVSKDNYVSGSIVVDGNSQFPDLYDTITIKGRGNSTWNQPKKPYKFKLQNKQSVLGMPADKEWNLLANYLDKSMIRNAVGFEIGQLLHFDWTPRRRFVEIVLNGIYQGQYMLTETVKSGTDRLNVKLMDPKKANDTVNSFLVEADYRHDAIQTWTTAGQVPLNMKDPDSVSQKQLAYVQRTMQGIEKAMDNGEDLRNYLNMDSWIKWSIANELIRNRDAILYGSCFFYKDTTGKIAAGPLWDMDLSAGAYVNSVPEGWYVNQANWFSWLFKQPYYLSRYKEIWNQYRDTLAKIPDYIDRQVAYLDKSQTENYKRWSNLSTIDYEGQYVRFGYKNEIIALKDFMTRRFNWMDSTINKF